MCIHVVDNLNTHTAVENVSIEMVSVSLKRMIREEAHIAGQGKKMDFQSVFNYFDEDLSKQISVTEFKNTLERWQLTTSLSSSQIPALLALFDTKGKGYITYDDFVSFANIASDTLESKAAVKKDRPVYEDSDCESESSVDELSPKPPDSITRNTECDNLIWFLWKECYKQDSHDTEGIINDIESLCSEVEISNHSGGVNVREFWNLLFELKLRGSLTNSQYEMGIKYLLRSTQSSHGRDDDGDDHVDYESLCRYMVRMGRAHYSIMQEKKIISDKKFTTLITNLKADLKQTSTSGSKDDKPSIPRYERIFLKMDTDGDGILSVQEFKLGLLRLQYKDSKLWTNSMIQRLFSEISLDNNNTLSVRDFVRFINDGNRVSSINDSIHSYNSISKNDNKKLFLSDDEDDEIFSKKQVHGDTELFKKTSNILFDMVPISNLGHSHINDVKIAIKKFFSKSDTDNKGVASEERFRSFCRRSGLQEGLTSGELRRLMDKLRKPKKQGAKDISSNNLIDYDKLCRLIVFSAENDAPIGKAEVILQKLQGINI